MILNRTQVPVYGEANPPPGFEDFVARTGAEHPKRTFEPLVLSFTKERWDTIRTINTRINSEVRYRLRVGDVWAYPEGNIGDCRSIVLAKRDALVAAGIPRQCLAITIVLDDPGLRGHVVLTLRTDRGDYILDNQRNDVVLWTLTDLTFLQRQRWDRPIEWVSLNPKLVVRPAAPGEAP